jgi:hypothetical protein
MNHDSSAPLSMKNDASRLNPNAVRCAAKSKRTGKRCKNPAVRGKRVCRLHGGLSLSGEQRTDKQKANRPPAAGKINRGCFQKGNQAARKHGAYSLRLSPQEKEYMETLRAEFTTELEDVSPLTAFDRDMVDRLALACLKFDAAISEDTSPKILDFWHRMIMDLLRGLRLTRASRKLRNGEGRSGEEVMAMLLDHIKAPTKEEMADN